MFRCLSRRVLFHPDYNRRFRNHTGSADPFAVKRRSRTSPAGVTAGEEFHLALRRGYSSLFNEPCQSTRSLC